ncbi:MAG TPA: aminotransferase class III-fold pyridoxal phosphate-dependent enzyme [Candidatus Binatia bacterium]|nr:aminotransferase class III-fold pyridoxal phosphate-dependent enzyme [Candidatus Binatia bacterium]
MDPQQDPYAGMSERKRRALERAREYGMPGRVETWLRLGTPLVIGRREGYRIWDLDGRELLDLHLNGGTFNLGHRNPELQAALVEALAELDIGNHHFPAEARGELAEKLARSTPGDLHYSVFTPSGSEANDLAIRAARWATGRRRIVALEAGFHGATGLSGAAGRDASARLFRSDYPDEFATVPFDDLRAMERALAPGDVAAVLLETIPATYGFPVPSPGYLPGVKALCERYGAILVADEVQTGLGRTGRLWAIDGFGVEPDVLVTGKGLSGGLYPISAVVMTRAVGGFLREQGWAYVSTFGGAEIGCRVAARVLEICGHPETLAHVQRIAARLASDLAGLRARHPILRGIRQQGLVIGLEVDDPIGGVRLSRALYERGVWAMFAAFEMSVLQFKPGLLVDDAYCDTLLERLDTALGDLERERV